VTLWQRETLWQDERKFEVHGEKGGLIFMATKEFSSRENNAA